LLVVILHRQWLLWSAAQYSGVDFDAVVAE
jgi:hypothetical protein